MAQSELSSSPSRPLRGGYRGRIAPTPSGRMHLGHARTFWLAQARAREHSGLLLLRVDDLDHVRCRDPRYLRDIIDDLHWFGIHWDWGPASSLGYGEFAEEMFYQSKRGEAYLNAWRLLYDRGTPSLSIIMDSCCSSFPSGVIYPSKLSRKDVERALSAPHLDADTEPVFPTHLRPRPEERIQDLTTPFGFNWRFQVPDGRVVAFTDNNLGYHEYTCGVDFGDFVVYRSDGICAYELAVVVDDHAMGVTEVVRGADLLLSTARQLLVYEALGLAPPEFYHCTLVTDSQGKRLAKRDDSKSLRAFRDEGAVPSDLLKTLFAS